MLLGYFPEDATRAYTENFLMCELFTSEGTAMGSVRDEKGEEVLSICIEPDGQPRIRPQTSSSAFSAQLPHSVVIWPVRRPSRCTGMEPTIRSPVEIHPGSVDRYVKIGHFTRPGCLGRQTTSSTERR